MLNIEQTNILLRRINPSRIEQRKQAGMNLSYLSQHDVRAHLIRVFGFCGFDLTTLEAKLAFEDNDGGKWNVGYQVTMQLVVKDDTGHMLACYSETAVGTSTQGRRGEAHDMAMKTASSDAMKRCAINLGDQYGLSLYNNGSTDAIVKATLVGPHLHEQPHNAPQEPVKAPVSDEHPDPLSLEGDEPSSDDRAAWNAPDHIVQQFAEAASLTDNAARILEVASLKAQHAEYLDNVTNVEGQPMTIGRFGDLIAAGAYTGKE